MSVYLRGSFEELKVNSQKFLTNPFPVPQVAFFPTNTTMRLLGVSQSTLERYRNTLLDLCVPRFSHYFYSKGYYRDSVICLWEYTQIVRQAGLVVANESINLHMKLYWCDHD